MLLKLSLRNVRRSARDYGVYFVTLTLAVAIFYAFNSVGSQDALSYVLGSDRGLSILVDEMMGLFSVVVAFVLGFLVLYANRFLIKRRKKEFGTYLLLGMRPSQVSAIVLMETVFVGLVSFLVGIVLGIVVSQGLSFLTAAMFDTVLDEFRFVFSPYALCLTAACFACIYVIALLFNVIQVRRCKLITLLSAHTANERQIVRNPWISALAFVVALVLIALAYWQLKVNGFVYMDEHFAWATALMLVGTLLFFWSVSGFVVLFVEHVRAVRFSGLNMFTLRQLSSKINTAFLSLWAVCVLLFVGVTTFASGMGIGDMFMTSLRENTVYDATVMSYTYEDDPRYIDDELYGMNNPNYDREEELARREESLQSAREKLEPFKWDTGAYFASAAPSWSDVVKASACVCTWKYPQITFGDLAELVGYDVSKSSSLSSSQMMKSGIELIPVSQYNASMVLAGADPLVLADSTYAINNNVEFSQDFADAVSAYDSTLEIAGITLKSSGLLEKRSLGDMVLSSDVLELIVPDEVVAVLAQQGDVPFSTRLNIQYLEGVQNADDKLVLALGEALPLTERMDGTDWAYEPVRTIASNDITKSYILANARGVRMIATYLAIYIGFVLLIATAAVISIQQLSEVSDSEGRYRVLAEIGCDKAMVLSSLRKQIVAYFLAPLALAACHTACAVKILTDSLMGAWGSDPTGSILWSIALVAVVYGGYMLVTLFLASSSVRTSLGKRLLG